MKKLLLTIGSISAVVAPVVAVVSCGDDKKTTPTTPALDDATSHAQKSITLGNQTATDIPGTSLAKFVDGVYTTAKAAADDTDKGHAPKTVFAIAHANVTSKIATTGHYSILVNLLKQELTNEEALLVHIAFVRAHFAAKDHGTNANALDGNTLEAELKKLSTALQAKLNIATVFTHSA